MVLPPVQETMVSEKILFWFFLSVQVQGHPPTIYQSHKQLIEN